MKYIASCSCGKDSLCLVLMLIEKGYPLDEVVFFSNGMDFEAIYRVWEKLVPVLQEHGIKPVVLTPKNAFLFDMLERPVESKEKGFHLGYGWCGGMCRWGTREKIDTIAQYAKTQDAMVYVGIAADEKNRLEKEKRPWKLFPLVDWGFVEKDCLDYCFEHGWNWLEKANTPSGTIDLYDILDRVSCWCCCNKNRKELKNIWHYLPEYWEKLKELQFHLDRPMKKLSKGGVPYGNLFDMEKVFQQEVTEDEAGQSV